MNFKEELANRTAEANRIIRRYLPAEEGFPARLAEAMNYNMEAPGKRLRPVLMLETYRVFGGTGQHCEPFAAALEMIHTHSLIHDDLPALDDDAWRRNRQTTHIVYGEALAVLCGDALLNYAYETALRAFDLSEDSGRTVRALRILARKTGISGMLGGQSVDVMNEDRPLTRQMLDYINLHKTSALIEAAMMIGAVTAGASAEQVSRMEQAGRNLGRAFQIQDDILDVTGDEAETGKPVHSDEKNQKTTYVTLLGIEGAREEAQRLTDRTCAMLDMPGGGFLRELVKSLMSRRK